MKELSIEEKARRYDEAIERAKCYKGHDAKCAMEYVFPELAELDDEKIRKELISFLKSPFINESITDEKVTPWISWLEKQNSNVDNANKEYWRGYREGKQEILDKYAELEKQGEQKPAWSEEDEKMLECAIDMIEWYSVVDKSKSRQVSDWLKSLRPQPKYK